jgi:hypothetical protein
VLPERSSHGSTGHDGIVSHRLKPEVLVIWSNGLETGKIMVDQIVDLFKIVAEIKRICPDARSVRKGPILLPYQTALGIRSRFMPK